MKVPTGSDIGQIIENSDLSREDVSQKIPINKSHLGKFIQEDAGVSPSNLREILSVLKDKTNQDLSEYDVPHSESFKEMRLDSGCTQTEIAKHIGVTHPAICHFENGNTLSIDNIRESVKYIESQSEPTTEV